ncbi:MAG: protein-tyrosine-phosphatase [Robiginitomaculum sp.]|nr:MAG: protein-tyrosine-phosphatase [Robiginitomaculum sp.]
MSYERKAVLFICLGNICRSPTAEAVFKTRSAQAGLNVVCDSAGTGGWHAGDRPDGRAMEAGKRRGYSFHGQTSRKIETSDFETFDFIVAMDQQNLSDLRATCPPRHHDKLSLFLDFAPHTDAREVPDPYYGGEGGFDHVLDLVEIASEGLIVALTEKA